MRVDDDSADNEVDSVAFALGDGGTVGVCAFEQIRRTRYHH